MEVCNGWTFGPVAPRAWRPTRAHRWPLVVTLHNQAGRWVNWGLLGAAVYCGAATIRQPPMPHRTTVVAADPYQARPPASPLRTCSVHRYATGQTPWYHWLASWPLDKQGHLGHGRAGSRSSRATPGGVPEPCRVCVSHSHFWAKIVTLSSPTVHPNFPQVHHCPPQVHPHFPHLPPTTHTWLIEVNRGCAKVSIGCLAVGLYVPASAVQKTIGDYR